MSSSGRTPLPEWRPKLAAINANIVAGLKQSKRKPVPCKRPTPVENEEIDHTQVPVVALADGVVLTNGKYRCNKCGNKMSNTKKIIQCHNSKLHPKNGTSAYLRRIARNPTPCGKCGKICSSKEMLHQHNRIDHRGEQYHRPTIEAREGATLNTIDSEKL
ncbi:hypothetical protein F4801DRAFT_599272 [Xylaria longipes]|nr:hypothetical protein F4801DRAFT_599272 [Xylaria longipes]